MASSEMLRRVALVRADVSEELSPSFIRVTRIVELGTTLAVTCNRRSDFCTPIVRNRFDYILHNVIVNYIPNLDIRSNLSERELSHNVG
jgi:hypothetical protein